MTGTLKSICERCAHLQNPQLDFIPDELRQYREIIRRDLNELIVAASIGLEKVVAVLAGSILEAVLYCFLESQRPYLFRRYEREFLLDPKKRGLQKFVEVFNRSFADLIFRLPDVVVVARDLVHASREVSELAVEPDVCARAARDVLPVLDALLEKLAKLGASEPGDGEPGND